MSSDDVAKAMANSLAVVVPSTCWEGFPRVISEACAAGRPLIAARHGSLRSIVTPELGWAFDPTATDLAAALTAAYSSPTGQMNRGANALRYWQQRLSPQASAAQLISAYKSVVAGVP